MTPGAIGVIGFATILVLIGLRVPIAIVLIIVPVVGISAIRGIDVGLGQLKTVPFEFIANWNLTTIPMFLLMGALFYHSGMSTSLFDAARAWLGRLPGGLAIAANMACTAFAAACGSSMATAAAMGRLAIPEMLKAKYDHGLAAGVVASAGTIGSMIPPSILFVLYGIFAEQSISQLLIAGILPGLLTAFVYSAMILIRCRFDPKIAPMGVETPGWGVRLRLLMSTWPLLALILGIIGGLYSGFFTPTEAGAVGAAFVLLMGVFVGRLTFRAVWAATIETLVSTASLLFIAVGAILVARFLTLTGIPDLVGRAVSDISTSPIVLVVAVSVVYVILGMFLEGIGIMVITLPLFLPLMKQYGFDLIWFGVLVVKFLEVGLLTPPVGLNVYVIKTVVGDQMSLETIFRGCFWFLGCEVVVVGLLVAFPAISLYLPSLMH